jgi:hypothetical protein
MTMAEPKKRTGYDRLWPVAALLVAAQAVFILYSRRGDYFFLDDFLGFIVARTSGLTFAYLTHDVFGQFAPGYRLADYLYTYAIGLHYTGVRLFDIVTIGAGTVLLLLLARAWRVRLAFAAPAIAFIPFSPIFVVTFQWFSSALHVLPGMVLGMAALLCLGAPAPLRMSRRVGGAALFACGLLFYAKTLFLSVLLFALRVFVALQSGEQPRAAAWRALRELAFCIPVGVIYLAIVVLGHYSSGRPPTGILPVLAFVRVGFFDGFCANLFGIDPGLPGRRALACLLLLLPVAASLARNPRTILIWSGFFLQFILAMVAISYGRVTNFGAEVAALSRYHSDTAVFFLACLLICLGDAGRQSVRREARGFMMPLDGAGVAAALTIAILLIRGSLAVPLLYAPDDGRVAAYVTRFRQSLHDAGSGKPIFDSTVPNWVMAGWMAPLNRLHYFALLFEPGANFTTERKNAILIDGTGQASP